MNIPQMNTDEPGLNETTFKVNGCAMDVINAIINLGIILNFKNPKLEWQRIIL